MQIPSGSYAMVLHHDNNIVLYNERDSVLVVDRHRRAPSGQASNDNSNTDQGSSSRHLADITRCPLCQHPISPQFAFMAQTYFRILQTLNTVHRPFSGGADQNLPEDDIPSCRNLPTGLLNNGYYRRFFKEVKVLGAGSFGAVYRCIHHLEDMEVGHLICNLKIERFSLFPPPQAPLPLPRARTRATQLGRFVFACRARIKKRRPF